MRRVGSSPQGDRARAMVLKSLRAKRGLTQTDAARKAECSFALISRIERGDERPPSGERLFKMLEAYSVSPKYYEQLLSIQEKELLKRSKKKDEIIRLVEILEPHQLDAIHTVVSDMTSK